MASEKNRLVLIDGHSTVHKSYHAIGESLTNSKGEPTSAIYLFLNSFLKLYREIGFQYILVVFDPPGGSFRDQMFKEYKANRPPAPEDLKQQDRRIREMLKLMGVPMLELAGFEADDVLADRALRAVEAGGEALICSVDKDLLQIVRPGITIYRDHLKKVEWLDEEGVREKLGITPAQVPVYLGLVGDTADNIPGVPGVGKKTAEKLLKEYGTLEGILEAAPSIKQKKLSENLQLHAEAARLSTELATLNTDCVEAPFQWEDFAWEYKPTPALRDFFREMEFHSFVREMGGDTVEERKTDYRILQSEKDFKKYISTLNQSEIIAIDTETTDLDTFTADLVGISISHVKDQGVYIPIGHRSDEKQLPLGVVREGLNPLFKSQSIRWAAQNWNYDYKILKKHGFAVDDVIVEDTMIAAYLLQPDRPSSLGLKQLALAHLGIQMTEITDLPIGDGAADLFDGGDGTMASVPIADAGEYACQDTDATFQLHEKFTGSLGEQDLIDLFRDVETPLVTVLAEMELEGVRLDKDHFRNLARVAEERLRGLTVEIHELAGEHFNINSPRQVATILFEKLGLSSGKKGKSGAYSTDVSVLEGLRHAHPLPAKLLEYRGVEKLKNTYIEPLPGMVRSSTGRLHTSFNQTVAATGRLSSSNPNLQNIPVRTEEGREIRRGFIPRADGWKLLAADYSQIELRILAHLSGDKALCEAFRTGGDVHTLTASKIFDTPIDSVSSTQRSQAKAINFGIIYGMSEHRLSRDLEITHEKAKSFITEYFRVYSGVKEFIEGTKEQARADGFVRTLLGRRRFITDINSRNFNNRSFAERIAVNTPIQGTSADMIKLAMIRVFNRMRREKFEARMILQVHDELIFDVPERELESLSALVVEEMSTALPLNVPIHVDVEVGNNWSEC
ncbi:MAG: DNA polymerase I [Candidatus Sumerlaeia bacterium]|nr:DNA polymerase I [Candidatus Sumerlaeia bacterium]